MGNRRCPKMKIDERGYIIGFAINNLAHLGFNDIEMLVIVNDILKKAGLETISMKELDRISKINLYVIAQSFKLLYREHFGKELTNEDFIKQFGFNPAQGIDKYD